LGSIPPYSYAGTMGYVQGEGVAGALFQRAGRVAAGADDLRSVGRVLQGWPCMRPTRHRVGNTATWRPSPRRRGLILIWGSEFDRLQSAFLDLCAQRAERRKGRQGLVCHRSAGETERGQPRMPSAHRARCRGTVMRSPGAGPWRMC